ncbi:rRNA processing/ribosome biogenesis-domain-containing protein [Apodospora peruviana]|uniref:Pre-rRNA-processing protein RIX1 n=1 Tax=Apodospora peruviana TaxID=516989 RepID=A0AAE0ICI4_9PEZI|nr:rRNA processing/ribosome biogenesis-domain-containing protein [Apodospora peruviana]
MAAAPPDLRVICRRLASTPADQLTRLCPVLVGHVLRCGGALSSSQEAKGSDKSSETPVLIHRLKAHITTLLTGKNPSGRFAAVCLIKAVIDVGGWECLRTSDPWIRGLISILQKPDPLASKELCIVTLTRIYTLLQGYQTLVREMATPTLPDYVKACLQLIKPLASGKPLKTPASLIETVICSFSKIVILYPTTMRTFSGQIKTTIKVYIAPTSTDPIIVPQSLRQSSRRLSILLHYTAAKNGSSDEWVKAIRASIKECHATTDQVFRAVHESWESTTGYRKQAVQSEADPAGGGDSSDDLPPWTGVLAGSERLVGLLQLLAGYFRSPTKAAITIPVGELLDLTSRLTLITLPTISEDTVEMNAAIGKDEKAELWSVLPDIHTVVMRLHIAIIHRLQENSLPLSTDLLDQMVRVFNSSRHVSSVRETTYTLAKELLLVSGPTLLKLTVSSLAHVIQSCCQDILRAAGHAEEKSPKPPAGANGTGSTKQPQQKAAASNADDYLTKTPTTSTLHLSASHKEAADALLPLFLSHLPQRHLSPDSRGLVDRTAILSNSKTAMLASCLHPYKDSRGRYYPSILPFLTRQFPHDQDVEVLRTNLIRDGRAAAAGHHEGGGWDPREGLEDLLKEKGEEAVVAEEQDHDLTAKTRGDVGDVKVSNGWGDMEIDSAAAGSSAAATNPFFVTGKTEDAPVPVPVTGGVVTPLKRKASEEAVAAKTKKGKAAQEVQVAIMPKVPAVEEEHYPDSDSDSDAGSIEIDMTMEDDEEEDEEDEEDSGEGK